MNQQVHALIPLPCPNAGVGAGDHCLDRSVCNAPCGDRRSCGGRPRGTFGEVATALVKAAEAHGAPATVRELAVRAGVGFDAARYTAPRLVDAGQLVVVEPGRPAKLAVPTAPVAPHGLSHALKLLARSFWGHTA